MAHNVLFDQEQDPITFPRTKWFPFERKLQEGSFNSKTSLTITFLFTTLQTEKKDTRVQRN